MIPLSATLEAHAKASRRQPSVRAFAHARRGNLALTRWTRYYTGAEPDSPHAATLAPDGALVRARNAAGTLYVSRVAAPGAGSTFSTWTNLTAGLLAGSGVALAQKSGELLLAYTTGTALVVRTSTNNGTSWSAPTTVTTEASNIGSIAAAYGTSGNPCLFYTLGTSTTLKRLRRTSGTWAASGTNWSRSASVASLTGLSAAYMLGDFHLLITGTEATTTHKRAWGVVMGDGAFPANLWSGLVAAAEADTSSTVTFAGPSVAVHGSVLRAAFARREAGSVAGNRAMETATAQTIIGATGAWTEPTPHEAETAYGLALAFGSAAWATTPSGVWRAELADAVELTDRLLAARYRIGPTGARCTVELDNANGALSAQDLVVGGTLELWPGYRSAADGSPETALLPRFLIQRVTYRQKDGRSLAQVDAGSALDALASWRAPQAWQSAAGSLTRAQLAARIAARAGFELTQDNTGSEWNEKPSLALALGESAASALARLSAVTAAGIVGAESDGIVLRGFAAGDASTYSYGLGAHPVSFLELTDQPPPANWLRLQGADRYAETADYQSVYQHGPQMRPVRSLDVTSDASATAAAAAARRRDAWAQELGELVAPFQPGTELFDVVTVNGSAYRVLAHGLDYRRGPQGARYDTILTLGAL